MYNIKLLKMPKSRNRKQQKQKAKARREKIVSDQNRVRNYFQQELMKEMEAEMERIKAEQAENGEEADTTQTEKPVL